MPRKPPSVFFGDVTKQVSVITSKKIAEEMPVVDYSHLVVIIYIIWLEKSREITVKK